MDSVRPESIPDVQNRPEIMEIIRAVGTGATAPRDAFLRLCEIVGEFLPPRAAASHGQIIGNLLFANLFQLRKGSTPSEEDLRRWRVTGSGSATEHEDAAARGVATLIPLVGACAPDSYVRHGAVALFRGEVVPRFPDSSPGLGGDSMTRENLGARRNGHA